MDRDRDQLADVSAFLEEVRRRPTIWDAAEDKSKVGASWRQICVLNWPEFNGWPPDLKRTRCLELQKRWKDLEQSFTKHYLKSDGKEKHHPHHEKLAFLIPSIMATQKKLGRPSSSECRSKELTERRRTSEAEESSSDMDPSSQRRKEGRPSSSSLTKRRRTSEPEDTSDAEEDRHFLLSLVSWMQQVPRGNKLALRADMLRLISKYTSNAQCDTTTTDSPQY